MNSMLQTRRHWLSRTSMGLGATALHSLLSSDAHGAQGIKGLPHLAPKAKRVICLFMSGGMSQFESFDHKPVLTERNKQPMPASVFKGRQPLGMSKLQGSFLAQGSTFPFKQYGSSGAWFSDRFTHLAVHADKICFLKGMVSDAVNHDPAIIFANSGAQLPGRPVMGSWLSYGLGSENENLPAFIVLVTKKPADQPLSSRLWDSGFLPSQHQGVPFRAGKEPVLYLNNPRGLPDALQGATLAQLRAVQADELARRQDPRIQARIEQYEMAFRMQTAVPGIVSLDDESRQTLDSYGPDVDKPGSYARNCVLAPAMREGRALRAALSSRLGSSREAALAVRGERP